MDDLRQVILYAGHFTFPSTHWKLEYFIHMLWGIIKNVIRWCILNASALFLCHCYPKTVSQKNHKFLALLILNFLGLGCSTMKQLWVQNLIQPFIRIKCLNKLQKKMRARINTHKMGKMIWRIYNCENIISGFPFFNLGHDNHLIWMMYFWRRWSNILIILIY